MNWGCELFNVVLRTYLAKQNELIQRLEFHVFEQTIEGRSVQKEYANIETFTADAERIIKRYQLTEDFNLYLVHSDCRELLLNEASFKCMDWIGDLDLF